MGFKNKWLQVQLLGQEYITYLILSHIIRTIHLENFWSISWLSRKFQQVSAVFYRILSHFQVFQGVLVIIRDFQALPGYSGSFSVFVKFYEYFKAFHKDLANFNPSIAFFRHFQVFSGFSGRFKKSKGFSGRIRTFREF